MRNLFLGTEVIVICGLFSLACIYILGGILKKMIIHWINNLIAAYYKSKHTTTEYKIFKPEIYDVFKKNGEGFYYTNIVNRSTTNFIAKAIRFFTKSTLVHSIIMLYSEDLKSLFTTVQWENLNKKWKYFYGEGFDINTSGVKVLVLGSADVDGINYHDFSHYSSRSEFSIRKVPNELTPAPKEVAILNYLCSKKVMYEDYDYIGLSFFFISRFIEDPHSAYCSELVYDAFNKIGIQVAKNEKPSPAEIEAYKKEWVVYNTIK